jgi:hypothetical protein
VTVRCDVARPAGSLSCDFRLTVHLVRSHFTHPAQCRMYSTIECFFVRTQHVKILHWFTGTKEELQRAAASAAISRSIARCAEGLAWWTCFASRSRHPSSTKVVPFVWRFYEFLRRGEFTWGDGSDRGDKKSPRKPLCPHDCTRSVNQRVVGSSPTSGARFMRGFSGSGSLP